MSDKAKPENDDKRQGQPDTTGYGRNLTDRTVFGRKDTDSIESKPKTAAVTPSDPTRVQAQRQTRSPNQPSDAKLDVTSARATHQIKNDATRVRLPNTRNSAPVQKTHNSEQTRIPPVKQESTGRTSSSGSMGNSNQPHVLKGRFTLEKVIGVGGMGVVYKATDRLKVEARDREPHVAIKVLSEEFKAHPESFIALQRESRKTQRIAHPNVVKVFDFDRDGDTVFMTMEYMEGVPLDQLIKQYSATGLPRDDAWVILKGLCSALIHAHAENIVHSDFKPGNIFITNAGVPKIFDFGIARAVANVDRSTGKIKDRTVFDVGSLGALTPAYASLEMLQGHEPDIRDDIYALGCIAYEMLTGQHPFNRIPADEAYKSRLKPRKIPNIKKRQWRAIEKALAFRRGDRVSSVEEFYNLIQPKVRTVSIIAPTIVVLVAIAIATYLIVSREQSPQKQTEIQVDQIEFNIRYNLFKDKINKLISESSFTSDWESSMWEEVSGITSLLKNTPDKWLMSARRKIYDLYIGQYKEYINNKEFNRAKILLSNAYRYTDDTRFLDSEQQKLAEYIEQETQREKVLAEERRRKQDVRETHEKKAAADDHLFDLALKNVNQQLQCQSKLNMREFGIAVGKLRSVDQRRYAKLENNIIVTLAECISRVAKIQPERAMEDKNYALRIFDNNRLIAGITIAPRDACNKSIAGLGARGERAVCRDKISGGGEGPAMVVIPGNSKIKSFAIGKYEVSIREINEFCRLSSLCSSRQSLNENLPAVNIDISLARNYAKWLSTTTNQKYRLPTREEWMYAANSTNKYTDPNRNCALNSRGIEKGGELVRANTGVQNSWGLVNYLGNAQEWAYDQNRNLVAVGGSFQDSMDNCTVYSEVRHSGKADDKTGFRVVREVVR